MPTAGTGQYKTYDGKLWGINMHESTVTEQPAPPTNAPESEFEPGQLPPEKLYRRRRYIRARINALTRRYNKLRSDLLVAEHPGWKNAGWQRDYALRSKEYLVAAKQQLLSRRPRIYLCSSLLYFVEGNLAWLYSPGILIRRCENAVNRLEQLEQQGDKTLSGYRVV